MQLRVEQNAGNKFELLTREQLKNLPKPEWLIKKTIESSEVAMIYGAPGSGKTFVALDMCLCIATGRPWMGNETQKRNVLYAFGEGAPGIEDRVMAWEKANNISVSGNVYFLTTTPKLIDKGEIDELCKAIDMLDKGPSLIVIDTLSRAIAGSEENSAKEMSVVIEACGLLQKKYKAAILLVHHSSKESDNSRGSSTIEGAANTMIYVKKNKQKPSIISCKKQKNSGEFADIEFKLIQVGQEDDCSCVVQLIEKDNQYGPLTNKYCTSSNQKKLMKYFQANPDVIVQTSQVKKEAGIPEGSTHRTLNELIDLGLIIKAQEGFYRLTDEGLTITIN